MSGLLGLGAVLVLMAPGAWQRTARREAYLPDLEAQARRMPYDGALFALLGGRLMEAGEYAAAREALLHAVASGEPNETTWCALAAVIAATGDRNLAIGHLRMGLQALPGSTVLASALRQARATGPAARPGALALAISPYWAQPLIDMYAAGGPLNRPVAWWGLRHPEQSGFTTRQEWALAQPDNAEAQRLWGLALLRNRRLAEAGVALRRAFALAPNSPAVNLAVADAQEQQGLTRQALLQYLTCLKLRPHWLPALLGLGRTSQASGLTQIAVRCYRQAAVVDPASVQAWIGLGHSYQQIESGSAYDKSVAAYETALRLAPDDTDCLDDYALSLYKLSRVREAEAVLRRRLQHSPEDAQCHYLLGMVLMDANPSAAGQAEAELQTRESLRLRPGDPPAKVQLAQWLLQQDQATPAVSLLQDTVRTNPYNRRARFLLARAYRQTGQMALAEQVAAAASALYRIQRQIADLEERKGSNLLDRSVHERLADLYSRTGAVGKAQQERATLRLLQSDPRAAAQARQDFDNSLNQALGSP